MTYRYWEIILSIHVKGDFDVTLIEPFQIVRLCLFLQVNHQLRSVYIIFDILSKRRFVQQTTNKNDRISRDIRRTLMTHIDWMTYLNFVFANGFFRWRFFSLAMKYSLTSCGTAYDRNSCISNCLLILKHRLSIWALYDNSNMTQQLTLHSNSVVPIFSTVLQLLLA